MNSKTPFTLIFRNISIACLLMVGIFSQMSCSKSSASEKEQMTSFAAKNNITYVTLFLVRTIKKLCFLWGAKQDLIN